MVEIALKSEIRKEGGKKAAKRMRADGRVPAIVYAKGIEPVPISLDAKDVHSFVHGPHAGSLESVIVRLEIGDGGEASPRLTLIKEIQHDPIKQDVLHIDFHQVTLMEKIQARLHLVTVGDSPGVSEGGILEHALRELDVACRAMDLPEEARIDISQLGLGDSIHVRDIDLGPKIEILNDPNLSVVSVTAPRAEAVVVEEKEAEEPEVIAEKKAEEEETPPAGKEE